MATKNELIEKAEELGIDVDPNATKAEIESLIAEFEGDEGEDEGEGESSGESGSGGPTRKEGNPTDLANVPSDVKIPETAKPKTKVPADGRKLAGRYTLISKAHVRGMMLPVGTELELGEEDARRLLAQGAVKPVGH